MHMGSVRLDSKGRITMPAHIRNEMGMNKNTELTVVCDDTMLRLIVNTCEKNAELSVSMQNIPGMLYSVLGAVAKNGADIVLSNSSAMKNGNLALFHAIIDISKCKNIQNLKNDIRLVKGVKAVKINH